MKPGLGTSVGFSDPVFMAQFGMKPEHTHAPFPYVPGEVDKRAASGDKEAIDVMKRASAWLQETNSGHFHTWEDLKFLRDNWKRPLVLKGIQDVEVGFPFD